MSHDKNPLFRRAIIPWFDSDRTCWFVIAAMIFTGFFGTAGISVALESSGFEGYFWLPLLLVAMCTAVLVSTLIRLVRRHLDRPPR
jgi:hypothetical protein